MWAKNNTNEFLTTKGGSDFLGKRYYLLNLRMQILIAEFHQGADKYNQQAGIIKILLNNEVLNSEEI